MQMTKKEIWRLVFVLFLGQLVSFLLAVISFIASYIAYLGIDTPLTQSFCTYLALSLVYGSIFLCRRSKLVVPWYWYLALGFVDVQGNYLVVKAYQYSSITSVTLLDCWTIPWVMILTCFTIKTRYSLWQFVGAAICVIGLALVLLSGRQIVQRSSSFNHGNKPLLGDTLVIAGTFFYAMSNVGEEYCVKRKNLFEVLTMLGVFGALVSVCEISIVERKTLESIQWSPSLISLYIGYAAAGLSFYTLLPFILKMSGSALFNLSLLTSDLWAVVIRICIYHEQVSWLYYLAYSVVAIGLIIYSFNDTGSAAETTTDNEEKANLQEPLSPENGVTYVS
ncbi:putative solute carrier family 35 member SLC35F1/F2/F6 [Dioscorea sansibarensis]